MSTEILRDMLKMRILNPSNATTHLCRYLQSLGLEVVGGKRKYVIIEGLKYCITITAYDSLKIDCRQFDEDGVISLFEKTGKIYLVSKDNMNVKDVTRELNDKKYSQATSRLKIEYLKPMTSIAQLKTKNYKDIYMKVAYEASNEIIANTYRKLI